MRFAYADPPYPGQAKRIYGRHSDYAGEVDHAQLVARLVDDYPDGWALSTGASMLQGVIALCPPKVRVMAWVKPMSAYFKGISVQYSWEPVIMAGGRSRADRRYAVRDWCAASPQGFTFRGVPSGHVRGAKPPGFCSWLFDCLGVLPGDELDDLFPGSGAVRAAWEAYVSQPELPYMGPLENEPLFEDVA